LNRHLINPTPTLPLPLKGREIVMFPPFKGEARRGMGVSEQYKYVFSIMDS